MAVLQITTPDTVTFAGSKFVYADIQVDSGGYEGEVVVQIGTEAANRIPVRIPAHSMLRLRVPASTDGQVLVRFSAGGVSRDAILAL
ncbi:MAG: hypothetical protein NZR01_05490 [Bryobacteraceae bacterium]|nr:hypothetical protein [Bryobacteraceae bacterium]